MKATELEPHRAEGKIWVSLPPSPFPLSPLSLSPLPSLPLPCPPMPHIERGNKPQPATEHVSKQYC